GTVGANGYFADSVALRVGTASNPNITDDAQIRKGAPITISNLVFTPTGWTRTGVTVSADITTEAGTIDASRIFVADSPEAASGIALSKNGAVGNNYKTADGAVQTPGKKYLIAYDTSGSKATAEFTPKIDVYSPAISEGTAKAQNGKQLVSVTVTDTESGVGEVFASTEASNPAVGTRIPLTNVGGSTWQAETDISDYYIYAVDKVGNISAPPYKLQAVGVIYIKNYEELARIGVNSAYPLNGDYVQTASFSIPGGTAHTPIGDASMPFTGTYDGGGFTITGGKNMKWNTALDENKGAVTGLFGVFSGTAANLRLGGFDMNIPGDVLCASFFAGQAKNGKISNVSVTDSTMVYMGAGASVAAGGLVGSAAGTDIENCMVKNVSITAGKAAAGASGIQLRAAGIAGEISGGAVRGTSVSGGVVKTLGSAALAQTAGFSALSYGTKYVDCSTSATVVSETGTGVTARAVGGFGAVCANADSTYINCTSTGTVNATDTGTAECFVGGFVGKVMDGTAAKFTDCITIGKIVSDMADASATRAGGGFAAFVNNAGTIFNGNKYLPSQYAARTSAYSTYNDANSTNIKNGITAITAAAPTPSPLKLRNLNTPATINSMGAAFGYSNVKWAIKTGTDPQNAFALSVLEGDSAAVTQTKAVAPTAFPTIVVTYSRVGAADVTAEVPVLGVIAVPDFATLAKVGKDSAGGYTLGGSYAQTADISIPNNTAWTPIGDVNAPFSGAYDGGGKKITCGTGMTWNTVAVVGTEVGFGLFGRIDGGSVKNMTINNMTADVTASASAVYAGAVAALAINGTFESINVNTVNLTATNATDIHVGGAFGKIDSSTVNNCAVNGSITGNATNISNGRSFMGGFVGTINRCNVKNSTAHVNVTDNSVRHIETGGFCGHAEDAEYLYNNRCSGDVNITQSVAGNINTYLMVGGFGGQIYGVKSVINNISS
ncbi:MAG: hypothetical protein RSC25_07475, partial [Christensenella sp.]